MRHLMHLAWQWWDAVQQTNRPHGWGFQKITNGVIRDMKLWKVCIGSSSVDHCFDSNKAYRLELRDQRLV